MVINVWRRSARAAAGRFASVQVVALRSQQSQRVAGTLGLWTQEVSCKINRVARRHLSSTPTGTSGDGDSDAPSIWELAEQLRRVDVKGAREPVVAAIQRVAIKPSSSTDAREAQALDVIQSNVLESLLALLEDARLADFHVPTYLSLIKLSAEPLLAQELLRLNAPGTIATYLRHADPRLQAAACLTLGNLALEPTSQLAMASTEVVEPLFGVLASPHEAIQRAAVTTIGTIAGTRRGRQRLCEIDHIMALCGLLSSDYSDSMRSAVAFALGNVLSDHDAAAQDALRESGALPDLILLASPAYTDDVCASAAWAIHHGVHGNHESQSMVAEAGGIGMLFQHVFADDETLQTNALLALESTIAGHEANTESCRNNTDAVQLLELLHENAVEDGLSPSAARALDALLKQVR